MTASFPTYNLLQYLQSCKQIPQTPKIAACLGVTQVTVIKHLHLLEMEGAIEYTTRTTGRVGRGPMSVITLTQHGRNWKPKQPQPVHTPDLLPCGHPRSSLSFCLPCRNRDRREFCRQNRTVLPVLRSQMRRIG